MNNLIYKAVTSHSLTADELTELLKDNSINDELFSAADHVREKFVGNSIHLRGLIEFTNICRQNCMYCGLRRDNKSLKRYRLSENEIVNLAEKAVNYGYKTIVLQGGEDMSYDVSSMCSIIKKIKSLGTALTLSLGEKTYEEYKAYRDAGADRYLIRIETTDKKLYEAMDPGMSFENRLECLKNLRSLGFEVGTGSLIGLPGQTFEHIAKDILFFKEIDADMIGIGPFIPNADTPLKDAEGGSLVSALKVMALTRLLLPDVNIPATTAMESLEPDGRIKALKAGANVVMPNVTEGEYRKLYALYPGKACVSDTPAHCRGCISNKILSIGRTISDDYGFRNHIF